MTPGARRTLITFALIAIAAAILIVPIMFGGGGGPDPAAPDATPAIDAPDDATAADPASPPAAGESGPQPDETPPTTDPAADADADADAPVAGAVDLSGLRVAPPAAPDRDPGAIGSLDPDEAVLEAVFTRTGAGIEKITFADIWARSSAARQADAHRKAVAEGASSPPPMPPDEERYVLTSPRAAGRFSVPTLAAYDIVVAGQQIPLFSPQVWTVTAPGTFVTEIHNESGQPVLRITRRFTLEADTFQLRLEQRIENLTDAALEVVWTQYGPADLDEDRSRYMDRRRFRFGYLESPARDPGRTFVFSTDMDVLFEHGTVVKNAEKTGQPLPLWPSKAAVKGEYELSWFASTNRYFALAVYPPDGATDRSLADTIDAVREQVVDADTKTPHVLTFLQSPVKALPPQGVLALDLGVYAGPQDREIFTEVEPLKSLNFSQLILYQMSSFCAICTFQWLAKFLLWFLDLVHYVTLDWGVAIIVLVLVVRTILHPITKKSQISMQRFGKQMQKLKPEMDKLQQRYKNDPKKIQAEQMRLYREHGVNPFGMLGCLPMFLQTPIWIALYAMLYFAFDLRHEAAFWGIFQTIGDWPFLADLSSADHFFGELDEPKRFLLWNITGINLLPILMGAIFYVQQKYMSPPPSPTMSPEQMQQQKLMRVIFVVMFPLMLYSAPSGLTLYILTSSLIGIIESRYVRAHVDQIDLDAPPKKKKNPGKESFLQPNPKRKPKDLQARLYADALDRAKSKKDKKQKRYKKRGGGR